MTVEEYVLEVEDGIDHMEISRRAVEQFLDRDVPPDSIVLHPLSERRFIVEAKWGSE